MQQQEEHEVPAAVLLPPAGQPSPALRLELLISDMRGEMRERFGRIEERSEAAARRVAERLEEAQRQTDHRHKQNQQVLLSLTERVLAAMPRADAERADREIREDMHRDVTSLWTGIEANRAAHDEDVDHLKTEVSNLKGLRALFVKVVGIAIALGALAGGAIEYSVKYVLQHGWPFK